MSCGVPATTVANIMNDVVCSDDTIVPMITSADYCWVQN
jgi:hypothetical protein